MKFVDQVFSLWEFMGNHMPINNYDLWDFYVTVDIHSAPLAILQPFLGHLLSCGIKFCLTCLY